MRKLLLTAGAGVLAFWIGGCQSLPFFNSGEKSSANTPEASPSPKIEAPESSSPSPNLSNEPFPSPDVPQKSETAKDLILSTDPNERTQSLKQEIQTNTATQPKTSTLTTIPEPRDPFSNLPTIPIPTQASDAGDSVLTQLPELPTQQVPDIPNLPETRSPSSWREPVPSLPGNQGANSNQAAQQPNSRRQSPAERGLNQETPRSGSGQSLSNLAKTQEGQLPQQTSQQVREIPKLPELQAPTQWQPPKRSVPQSKPKSGGSDTTVAAQSKPKSGGSDTTVAAQSKPKSGGSDTKVAAQSKPKSGGSDTKVATQSKPKSGGSDTTVAAHPPATTQPPPPPSPPKPPELPSSSSQQVPSLPELPIKPTPPAQWRGPGFPPPPPPPPAPPPPPPPPPDTTIADGIEVSGVVEVGSQKQIIVKVPTEPTSRYVKVGQRLANGKVLVKRVDFKIGADPIVIFEQSGVEIEKEVGGQPTTAEGQQKK